MLDRLINAVELIEDGFALFDGDDRLVLCNRAYCDMLGEPEPDGIIGKPFSSLMDEWIGRAVGTGTELSHIRAEVAKRRGRDIRLEIATHYGASLRLITRCTGDGGMVATISDRSDDVQRAIALRQARTDAEAASAAKTEFLSSLSHELKTLLNPILGFAQLLQRDKKEPLSTRHKARVDQILSGGEHMLRLVGDVLDLSRIEAGRINVSIEPVRVDEVMEELWRTLDPVASRSGVRIQLQTPSRALPMVAVDRTRLTQILLSFGSNAIKYNRADGGTVTLAVSAAKPGYVRLRVVDNGLGIPRDKQEKTFQPFQRAGQVAGPIEGAGLGLAIAKSLAELMHGSTGFRSIEGEGSEFWVDVPVHAGVAPEQRTA